MKKPKKKQTKPYVPIGASPWPFPQRPAFLIIPLTKDPAFRVEVSLQSPLLTDIILMLLKPWKPYFPASTAILSLPPPTPEQDLANPFSRAHTVHRKRLVREIQKIRWRLRRFLHFWRFRRTRRTPVNTEDIATCSLPCHPVYLMDWVAAPSRRLYVFEASTIHKDITERLQTHDGFFEDSQPPRNPFTNLPLTLGQQVSIWNQLAYMPLQMSMAAAAFRRSGFSMDTFLLEFTPQLALFAFRQTMRDPTHEDTQDRCLDFIQYAHDQEAVDCYVQSYKHCLRRYPNHPLLHKWRQLCLQFYEASMLHNKNPQLLHTKQDQILDDTIPLINQQTKLAHLRVADLKLTRHEVPRSTVPVAVIPIELAAAHIADLLNSL